MLPSKRGVGPLHEILDRHAALHVTILGGADDLHVHNLPIMSKIKYK